MHPLLQNIARQHQLDLIATSSVSGGDINSAYHLKTRQGNFFVKLNDAARYPAMLQTEAMGLALLAETQTLRLPGVVAHGEQDGQQYLLLQWISPGKPAPDFWQHFGNGLALLHQNTQPQFGLSFSNYIGSLPQPNPAAASFAAFYADNRIMPLVQQLFNSGSLDKSQLQKFEQWCHGLPQWIPEEPPALLHGDLWAGNFLVNKAGMPVIIDPAPYYGHREMDIAMTKLFGGFDAAFYAAYQQAYPLQPGWQERIPLFQLYPVLVHAVLFGGGYLPKAQAIIRPYLY